MLRRGFAALNAAILVALVAAVTLPAPAQASRSVSVASVIPGAMYTGDVYGPVHPDNNSPAMSNYPVFPSPLVRAVRPSTLQQLAPPGVTNAGFVLDAFGGLHPYDGAGSAQLIPLVYPYFPGKDIARDLVFLTYRNAGGYVLDGYGGIHPFSDTYTGWGYAMPLPPTPAAFAYFPGRDVAIKITVQNDGSGYVLDAFGGIHPWAVTADALPVTPSNFAYWPNIRMARDIWIAPGSSATAVSGYVLDGYGGIHQFWGGTASAPPPITTHPYFAGHDIARAMCFLDSFLFTGYELDGYGGIHPFAAVGSPLPPPVTDHAYWPGQDVARALF